MVRHAPSEGTGQVPGQDRAARGTWSRASSSGGLRDGIYELRASHHGVHYRVLYFFHGNLAVVLSHGIIKEREVPPKEIDKAIQRKRRFQANPKRHTHEEL